MKTSKETAKTAYQTDYQVHNPQISPSQPQQAQPQPQQAQPQPQQAQPQQAQVQPQSSVVPVDPADSTLPQFRSVQELKHEQLVLLNILIQLMVNLIELMKMD